MALTHSIKRHKDLPDHLIYQKIFPLLPFKFLNRCKCISKVIYSLISMDAEFATDQSRSAGTSSSGFVYMTHRGLSFFPDSALVGVPDPSLNFLNHYYEIKLVCSTNGLLLLYGEFRGMKCLCVCNPATKDTAFVPNVDGKRYYGTQMGLVYDPCELPARFTIVEPMLICTKMIIRYHFDVFRSDTGKWTSSSQTIQTDMVLSPFKPLCAKGVIYWCCTEYLLWYDVKRDIAGSLLFPVIEGEVIGGVTNLGIYAGEITCCRAWSSGIEVWSLTGRSHWDRIHTASWDSMVDANEFYLDLQLHHKSLSDIFDKPSIIRPIGFDGQFVYIAVQLKDQDKTEMLFSWDTETGRVEKKGVVTIIRSEGKDQLLNYANSMARVPQIFNVTSKAYDCF